MEPFSQKTLFLKKKYSFKENSINIDFTGTDGDFSLFIAFHKIPTIPLTFIRTNTLRSMPLP
jgi:hypothetical protein